MKNLSGYSRFVVVIAQYYPVLKLLSNIPVSIYEKSLS